MASSPNIFIVKLPTDTPDTYLILKSVWSADQITLELADLRNSTNCNEWTGTIAVSDLKDSAADLEIPYDEFYAETKRALTTNRGLEHFEYDVTICGEFALRKVDDCRVLYVRVTLSEQPGLLHQLLLESVDTIASSRSELMAQQLDMQKLDMEFKMLTNSYEKTISEKSTNETEIMKKCASLLNSKKRRIAELQELLEEGKRLQEDGRHRAEGAMDEEEEEQLTQPMPVAALIPDTQRAAPTLPKRMKHAPQPTTSVAARAATTVGGLDVDRTKQRPAVPNGGDSSQETMNSEEMFNAMMR